MYEYKDILYYLVNMQYNKVTFIYIDTSKK